MVDVTIKTQRSKTAQARSDHMERLKDEQALPQIKVIPANDTMRRKLKHPSGVGFRTTGGATWPDDRFTRQRLKEGAITKA
jgi:hypothetical protein